MQQMAMAIATETEPSNGKLTILQPSTQLSRWIGEQIIILAEIFGESMTQAQLKGYVANLMDLDAEQLRSAFARTPRELKFFPKIVELRELAGAGAAEQADAECRRAWDVLIKYVSKWGRWNCEYSAAYIDRDAPKIEQRIVDCVRRSGGWAAYLAMGDDNNFPFVQKRFFEEYRAWNAVEQIAPERFLATLDVERFKELAAAKGMP